MAFPELLGGSDIDIPLLSSAMDAGWFSCAAYSMRLRNSFQPARHSTAHNLRAWTSSGGLGRIPEPFAATF